MANDWWTRQVNSMMEEKNGRPPGGIRVPPSNLPPAVHPQYQQRQQPAQQQIQPLQQQGGSVADHGSLLAAANAWHGGEAHRKEGGVSCPECGSATGFTQFSSTIAAGGNRPRARCFECGFNGLFSQAQEASWVG